MTQTSKLKTMFLLLLVGCSIGITQTSFSVNWSHEEKARMLNFVNNNQMTWGKRIMWAIVPILIQVTLSELIINFLSTRKTEEEKSRDKIENMVSINHEIQNQMEYIKPLCKNEELLNKIEQKYVSAFAHVLDDYEKHLYQYAHDIKNKKEEETKQ